MNNILYIDIKYCARCGNNHNNLLFMKFNNPVIIRNVMMDYWSTCPVTSEPILMNASEDD